MRCSRLYQMEELYLTLQPVQGTSFLCGLPGHLHILGAAILLEVSLGKQLYANEGHQKYTGDRDGKII